MNTYVTHLESALDGTSFPAGQVHTVHQGRPLWVRYDLPSRASRRRAGDSRRATADAVALPRIAAACRWTPSP